MCGAMEGKVRGKVWSPNRHTVGSGNDDLRVGGTRCDPSLHTAPLRTFCFALGLTSELLATILSAYWVLLCSEVPKKHLANPP